MRKTLYLAGLLAVIALPVPFAVVAQTLVPDSSNQTVVAGMQVLVPHIGGRVLTTALDAGAGKPAGAQAYTHQWPGVYFEAAFEGSRVVLKFADEVNEYRLWIDDLPAVAIAQPGQTEIAVDGIGSGAHRLRLEKVTESVWMLGAFAGFYIDRQAGALPVMGRARQIEFIGDSDMTGYGVRSATRVCTQDEVRLQSDAQQAYPALVARHFDADYQINAISGRGLVRNFDGMVPDHTMADMYARILPDETSVVADDAGVGWQPQIIYVGLGSNDFFSPLKPGEAWRDSAALMDGYIAGMEALLTTLHSRSPGAAIVLHWPDRGMLTDAEYLALDAAAKLRLRQVADRVGIKVLEFHAFADLGLAMSACDEHASLADHRKRADAVIARIAQQPEFWGGKD